MQTYINRHTHTMLIPRVKKCAVPWAYYVTFQVFHKHQKYFGPCGTSLKWCIEENQIKVYILIVQLTISIDRYRKMFLTQCRKMIIPQHGIKTCKIKVDSA